MGVGLCAIAPVPQRNGRPAPKADCFRDIRAAIEALITEPLERRMLDFAEQEHTLYAQLHPQAESLEFHWEPGGKGGRLLVMAKTSTVGPGYHAWVTGLVKEVGRRAGIAWDWSEDETEFARTGDFAALQQAMGEQLQAMANAFLEHAGDEPGEGSSFAVNMSMGFCADSPPGEFSQSPLGPLDRAWWEAALKDEHLPEKCREFYIWWGRERDAAYWRKLGLALLWTEVPWHPPANEKEEETCRLALDALDRAMTLDPRQPVPAVAMNELAEILDLDPEEDELRAPDPDGIGYHRRVMTRYAPGGWSLRLPGYFFQEWDQEEGQLSLYYADRSVFVSSYSIPLKDGKPVPAGTLAADFTPPDVEGAEPLDDAGDGYVRRAVITPYEEEGFTGRSLQGCVAADGQCAIITVIYADEGDREWAIETWKSLAHSGAPEAEPA